MAMPKGHRYTMPIRYTHTCKVCGDRFPSARRDARLCSNACRSKHSRDNLAQGIRSRPRREPPAAKRKYPRVTPKP